MKHFPVASLIGIANRSGRLPVIDRERHEFFAGIFENFDHHIQIIPSNISFKNIQKNVVHCCAYDVSLIDRMKPTSHYFIDDYLQSWKYFDGFVDMREIFQFNAKIIKRATERIQEAIGARKLSRTNVKVIGIHNRRGDIVTEITVEIHK